MKPATTTVLSLENKLRAYLEQTSLGSPFMENRPVASILSDIMAHQGGFVKGRMSVLQYPPLSSSPSASLTSSGTSSSLDPPPLSDDAFTNVVDSIVRMVTDRIYSDSSLDNTSSTSSSSDDDEDDEDDDNDGRISIIKSQIEDLQITLNNLLLQRNNNNITSQLRPSK